MNTIDLRSDTVTQPTRAIRDAIAEAVVGDDCFHDDRATNDLERYCAEFFGAEAALFTVGGTMSNQLAMLAMTRPGDEVISDASYHISYFESGGTARFSGVALNCCDSPSGVLTVADVEELIDRKARWSDAYSRPTVIVVENTVGARGGVVYPYETLQQIYAYASARGIQVYLDGARILNASAATGIAPSAYMKVCDAMSTCFSKGLCAPIGAVLVGKRDTLVRARTFRKWIGGDMHQSGIAAAGALYAIQHYWDRLAEDHEYAALLARELAGTSGLELHYPGTNMLFIDVRCTGIAAREFVRRVALADVQLLAWSEHVVRAVTHYHVRRPDIERAVDAIRRVCATRAHRLEPAPLQRRCSGSVV